MCPGSELAREEMCLNTDSARKSSSRGREIGGVPRDGMCQGMDRDRKKVEECPGTEFATKWDFVRDGRSKKWEYARHGNTIFKSINGVQGYVKCTREIDVHRKVIGQGRKRSQGWSVPEKAYVYGWSSPGEKGRLGIECAQGTNVPRRMCALGRKLGQGWSVFRENLVLGRSDPEKEVCPEMEIHGE